jgi:hypothetical protein
VESQSVKTAFFSATSQKSNSAKKSPKYSSQENHLMTLNLAHNWIAKVLSLLLAIAIWFLIKVHLTTSEGVFQKAPRARIVPESKK